VCKAVPCYVHIFSTNLLLAKRNLAGETRESLSNLNPFGQFALVGAGVKPGCACIHQKNYLFRTVFVVCTLLTMFSGNKFIVIKCKRSPNTWNVIKPHFARIWCLLLVLPATNFGVVCLVFWGSTEVFTKRFVAKKKLVLMMIFSG